MSKKIVTFCALCCVKSNVVLSSPTMLQITGDFSHILAVKEMKIMVSSLAVLDVIIDLSTLVR